MAAHPRLLKSHPRSLPAQFVPGMRIARDLDAQRVDGSMRAAEQRPQIRPAKSKIHGLLRPPDDARALAVGRHYPDAAGPGAVHPANAVDLQAIGYARFRAL